MAPYKTFKEENSVILTTVSTDPKVECPSPPSFWNIFLAKTVTDLGYLGPFMDTTYIEDIDCVPKSHFFTSKAHQLNIV